MMWLDPILEVEKRGEEIYHQWLTTEQRWLVRQRETSPVNPITFRDWLHLIYELLITFRSWLARSKNHPPPISPIDQNFRVIEIYSFPLYRPDEIRPTFSQN